MIPTMAIYFTDTGYVGKVSSSISFYALSTLGNLGHVSPICQHQFISINHSMNPKCSKGKISKLTFAGLMPDIEDKKFALDYCGNPN